MITETLRRSRLSRRAWPRWVGAVILMAALWMATLALVLRLGAPAPGVLIVRPSLALMATLPPEARILGIGRGWVHLQSPAPGLARWAYGRGAWLVLPAGLTGCISAPQGAGRA